MGSVKTSKLRSGPNSAKTSNLAFRLELGVFTPLGLCDVTSLSLSTSALVFSSIRQVSTLKVLLQESFGKYQDLNINANISDIAELQQLFIFIGYL